MLQSNVEEKRLKRLVRKNKYLSYIFLGILGIALIAYALIKNPKWKDVPMGIGTGIVATVIGFIILLILLPDESEEVEKTKELEKWGLEKIYPERKIIKIAKGNMPSENLDFIAFGLSHFIKANPVNIMTRYINNGLKVRIIVPHSQSRMVSEQQQMENNGSIADDIRNLADWVQKIEDNLKKSDRNKGSIEIKFYDNNPIGFYCRSDGKVWVGPYMPGTNSGQVITYEFLRHSKGGDYYAGIFENIWNEECAQIKMIPNMNYLLGNQEEAIRKVLEYFCECMKGNGSEPVIGVVVMFKDNCRKTFFSCNKRHSEKHNTHKKTDGLVGVMYEQNCTSSGTISLWRDYNNDITIKRECRERIIKTIKINKTIEKFKEDETIGILSAPIMNNEECIGAITFDFARFDSGYVKDAKLLKEIPDGGDVDSDNQICKYFVLADMCTKIVQKMLGQDISIQYKELFKGNWE